MDEERIIDLIKRIDDCTYGKLSQKEEDQLWVEFLKEPYWFNIFKTELHLTCLFKHDGKDH